MILKKSILASFAYVLFAFDSALKINFGFQVHIGLLFFLFFSGVTILLKPGCFVTFLKKDPIYFILMLYILALGLFFDQKGFLNISIYILLSYMLYLTCFVFEDKLGKRAFYWFQVVMITTGLIQYLAFKLFGYQISFIDAEHYQKGSSVSYRLRGFFVEPNWFSISFAFNTLLLVGSDFVSFSKKHRWLSFFTAVVFILNGSLTTVGLLLLIYSIPYVIKYPVKGMIGLVFMGLLLSSVVYFRTIINQKQSGSILNHSSRLIPFERVIDYQSSSDVFNVLFGNGLGSWGTLAVGNRLSVLVYEEESSARDGSEAPVMLFEFGIIGVTFLILDVMIIGFRARRRDIHLRGGICLFFVCLMFYPTLKFWIYMPYYFLIRAKIIKND